MAIEDPGPRAAMMDQVTLWVRGQVAPPKQFPWGRPQPRGGARGAESRGRSESTKLDGTSGEGERGGASGDEGELGGTSGDEGELGGTSRGSREPDGTSRGSGEPDGTSRGPGEPDGTSRGLESRTV